MNQAGHISAQPGWLPAQSFLHQLGDGEGSLALLLISADGDRVLDCSRGCGALFGSGPVTPGTAVAELLAKFADADRDALAAVLRGDARGRSECTTHVRPDGEAVRLLRWRGLPMRGEAEVERGRLVIVESADSQWHWEVLDNLIETLPAAALICDPAGHVRCVNPPAAELFGRAQEELRGSDLDDLLPSRHRDGHRRMVTEFVGAHGRRQMGVGREVRGLRADGSEVPLEIGLSTIATPDGDYVLATLLDLTVYEDAKAALERMADSLARTNAELEQFVHFASHDLQEPLRKLMTFSTLLAEDLPEALPEPARKDLEFIHASAHRMHQLVQLLLELSRTGWRALRVTELDLAACVADAVDIQPLMVADSGARVHVDPLPAFRGDRMMLTQLFQNLIGNAIKYVPADVTPEVRVTAQQSREGWVIGVKDNGIGIETEKLAHLFKPFRRLHDKQFTDGNGIGLAICKKVVERHGGRIWVESTPGRGSHFLFTLGDRAGGGPVPSADIPPQEPGP